MKQRILLDEGWEISVSGKDDWLKVSKMPMGVHEILHEHKRISDDFLIGLGDDSKWVAENDWVYRCVFKAPPAPGAAYLYFGMLDTIAAIKLNGEEIARSQDMYIPVRVDVSGRLKDENLLEIHFQSPYDWLSEHPLPPEWQGKIGHTKILRKPIVDFTHYLGGTPYLTPIGVFGDISLEIVDCSELTMVDVEAVLDDNLQQGILYVRVSAAACLEPEPEPEPEPELESKLGRELESRSRLEPEQWQKPGLNSVTLLYDPGGAEVGRCELPLPSDGGEASGFILVSAPKLWWPRGYGDQPLYTVVTTLYRGGGSRSGGDSGSRSDDDSGSGSGDGGGGDNRVSDSGGDNRVSDRRGESDSGNSDGGYALDVCVKKVGMRKLRMALDFDLHVNGVKTRMWGSNIAPLDGKTHRWNGDRAGTLLDLAEMANMNTLRVWSEGEPLADAFYDECDRRGILIWQEFYGSYGMNPDSPEYRSAVVREAEHSIARLRHHPCIFMWCGGNEIIMGAEYDHPGEKIIGLELFTETLADLCKKMDKNRYYQPTSPYGGEWANDPRTGDTHGYEMWWFTPGMEYPVAFSEHMRVSGPAIKSMRRWIPDKDKLWPAGYVDAAYPSKTQRELMPEAWFERVGNSLDIKAGPVYLFRDADTPEELAFKYAAAHAKSFKDGIKRSRMGRPSGSKTPRISNMHLIWKLNDTWPLIYSAIIDYYSEPYIPYYEAKRSYSPVMACFDIRDSITLWLVNDSPRDVSGMLEYGLFNPGKNSFHVVKTIEASMPAGRSGEIVNLDNLGQFRTENILYARFTDESAGVDYTNIDYVDIDRRLRFPDAKLTLNIRGDMLCVSSDKFARFVELSGDDGGDEFGWYFEDNYFDLLPGVEKNIRIRGRHAKGLISAKAHYSPHVATLKWGI